MSSLCSLVLLSTGTGVVDALRVAEREGFTQFERHELACAYRAEYSRSYLARGERPDVAAYLLCVDIIRENTAKWSKHEYEIVDGKHRRVVQ